MNHVTYRRDFPLTHKWTPFIKSFSYYNKLSVEDAIQESLLLEWEVSKKIQNLYHRACYFRKSLYRKLYSISNDKWYRKRSDLYSNEFEDGGAEDNLIENIVIVKPFDSLFYEYLIGHISQMLCSLDVIANEIFLYRIKQKLRWKEIKRINYMFMPHNQFYGKVRIIKDCVKKEILHG